MPSPQPASKLSRPPRSAVYGQAWFGEHTGSEIVVRDENRLTVATLSPSCTEDAAQVIHAPTLQARLEALLRAVEEEDAGLLARAAQEARDEIAAMADTVRELQDEGERAVRAAGGSA